MSDTKFDVVAIGNAILDVISHADNGFLARQEKIYGMKRGAMSLIDEHRAVTLYAEMGQAVESSGGSSANTIAGFGSFGGRGAFIGKVAQDQLGDIFRHDMKAQGIHFETTPLIVGAPTARCLILVDEDGERTMNTYLGASVELGPDDIDPEIIAQSQITYLEGYLFDPPHAKEAFRTAADLAHKAGRKVALTLSDPFCVDRHRADFLELVRNHVDILFANEEEIKSLYEVGSFDKAAARAANDVHLAALTRSAKGAVLHKGEETAVIPAVPVESVIDTTGAGDQFAAGVLFGLSRGMSLEAAGNLGALAAAEVISHMGPRPDQPYRDFVEKIAS